MTASFGDGKTLDVLADLIEKRVQAMRFETTENAVIATCITVLTSIRARTKVADPDDTGGVSVAERSDLAPGFRRVTKDKVVVCVRIGRRGPVDNSHPFHCIPSSVSSATRVFIARDVISSSMEVKQEYYLLANSLEDAKKYAEDRHKSRVKRHAGMARWALGLAQSQVSDRPSDMNAATSESQQIATSNVKVSKEGNGFSSGTFGVSVADMLRYAMLALTGGEADLDLALKKAANSTAAKINRLADLRFEDRLETPFPEVKGRTR